MTLSLEIESLKNTRSGICYVLGNAPSLLSLDIKKIMGQPSFFCNTAWHLPDFHPEFYIVAHPTFLDDYYDEFQKVAAKYKFIRLNAWETRKPDSCYVYKHKSARLMEKGYFGFDEKMVCARGRTVVLDAVQIADYLGFTTILIGGVDMDGGYYFNPDSDNSYPEKENINAAFQVALKKLKAKNKKLYKITASPYLDLPYLDDV